MKQMHHVVGWEREEHKEKQDILLFFRYWIIESSTIYIMGAVGIVLFFQILETWLPFDKRYEGIAWIFSLIKELLFLYFLFLYVMIRIIRKRYH